MPDITDMMRGHMKYKGIDIHVLSKEFRKKKKLVEPVDLPRNSIHAPNVFVNIVWARLNDPVYKIVSPE